MQSDVFAAAGAGGTWSNVGWGQNYGTLDGGNSSTSYCSLLLLSSHIY